MLQIKYLLLYFLSMYTDGKFNLKITLKSKMVQEPALMVLKPSLILFRQ